MLTDEQKQAYAICVDLTTRYGANHGYHVMTSMSTVQASCTIWVDNYDELDEIHKHLLLIGVLPSEIEHCYIKKYDQYSITYKGI